MTGIVQAAIALGTNYASKEFIEVSRNDKNSLWQERRREENLILGRFRIFNLSFSLIHDNNIFSNTAQLR